MIDTTGLYYDLKALQEEIEPFLGFLEEHGAATLTTPVPGDHCDLIEDAKTPTILSIYADIIKFLLPGDHVRSIQLHVAAPGRVRTLDDRHGYVHLIPINSNEYTFVACNTTAGKPKSLKEGNCPMMLTYRLPENGQAYILDGTKFHMISNGSLMNFFYITVETDRKPADQPKWTGLTAEKMTGHEDFLEEDLRPGFRFTSNL